MNPDAYRKMADTEAVHWWFAGRRAIIARLIKSLKMPKDRRILEIGCGTGGNLPMLSSFGKVFAIEMDPTAISIAHKKTEGRFDIRNGSFPDETLFKGEKFDLVCLFDVLEHIENDTETLKNVKNLLAVGGYAIMTVPAYQWLWSSHDEYLHHKRRYSIKDMKAKITISNLTIKKISHFNAFLFPLAVILRLFDRMLKKSLSSGNDVPPQIINKIFTFIFGMERYLIEHINFPFGVSLVCIMQNEH